MTLLKNNITDDYVSNNDTDYYWHSSALSVTPCLRYHFLVLSLSQVLFGRLEGRGEAGPRTDSRASSMKFNIRHLHVNWQFGRKACFSLRPPARARSLAGRRGSMWRAGGRGGAASRLLYGVCCVLIDVFICGVTHATRLATSGACSACWLGLACSRRLLPLGRNLMRKRRRKESEAVGRRRALLAIGMNTHTHTHIHMCVSCANVYLDR